MATYDDDPVGALTIALRRVLDRTDGSFTELLTAAGLSRDLATDQAALDHLVRDLNETRGLPGR